jgi:hypothetical protein
MTRTHIGLLILLGGVLLFGVAALVRRQADGRPDGGRALAVLSIVVWFAAILTTLGGIGVAISSAVFP